MHAFDASGLLDVWERSHALASPERSLALLAYGYPQVSRDELAKVPLGRRDALLTRLRVALFGDGLNLVATCPHCGGTVESALDAAWLAGDAPLPAEQSLTLGRAVATVRAATLADLIGLPPDAGAARRLLAARCVIQDDGAAVTAEALSDADLAVIAAALDAADPAATTELVLNCPDCGTGWSNAFDIAAFFWREIDAWARRTLREVHALARAYAWSERDVLALSPTRRTLYLELCGA